MITLAELKKRTVFRDMPDDALEGLIPSCTRVIKKEGERINFRRDGKDSLYIIESGYVSVRIKSKFLRSSYYFAPWRGPDQILGEMEMISEVPPTATIAITEETSLIQISLSAFNRISQDHPKIYRNLSVLLVDKILQSQRRSEIVQLGAVEKRVALALVYLSGERGYDKGTKAIKGKLRRQDLADYVVCKRGAIVKALGLLSRRNLISYKPKAKDGKIGIPDLAKLKKFAAAS